MSEPDHPVGDAPVEPAPLRSRRAVLKLAGLGLGATLGGAAVGGGAVRYEDVAAERRRGDGATVADGSAATTLRVTWRAQTTEKVLALTFDDGPGNALTGPLLDVLRDEDVQATFCVVGRQADAHRDLVRRQAAEGHEVANHSWTHPDLSLLDARSIRRELERTDELIAELTGHRPAVIRPPFGRVNGALMQVAGMSGQSIVLWDLRFQEDRYDSDGNVDYVLRTMRPGSIVLGHDAGSRKRYIGCHAVPALIREAKARGWTFATASQLLRLDGTPDRTAQT